MLPVVLWCDLKDERESASIELIRTFEEEGGRRRRRRRSSQIELLTRRSRVLAFYCSGLKDNMIHRPADCAYETKKS